MIDDRRSAAISALLWCSQRDLERYARWLAKAPNQGQEDLARLVEACRRSLFENRADLLHPELRLVRERIEATDTAIVQPYGVSAADLYRVLVLPIVEAGEVK